MKYAEFSEIICKIYDPKSLGGATGAHLEPVACFVLTELICAIFYGKKVISISSLPLSRQIAPNTLRNACNSLIRHKILTISCRDTKDEQVKVDFNHPLFIAARAGIREDENISNVNKLNTDDLVRSWHAAYRNKFGEPPKKDNKDPIRLRLLLMKHGVSVLSLLSAFIENNGSNRTKCTTEAFYRKHK